jgi:endonuclease YncB( thermonuclease family)|tara:strand:- start:941 stop:1357 length:417 start_codon:yes stop_codon:yes gene_type:complete
MSDAPETFVYRATLERVIDGDGFVLSEIDLGFNIKLANQNVRMAGIDTPESRVNTKRQPERIREKELGLQAKARLKELLTGDITIKSLGRGKYGRLLGIPYDCNGNDICAKLIEEGLASPYWGGTKKAKVRKDGTWGE